MSITTSSRLGLQLPIQISSQNIPHQNFISQISEFNVQTQLGSGIGGSVYKYDISDETFAVKVFESPITSRDNSVNAKNEFDCLTEL
jgi:hypothetical protein